MCFFGGGGGSANSQPETPAAAPAAPLPAADAPKIGQTRRDENIRNFGAEDGPNYRVRTGANGTEEEDYRVDGPAGITM